MPVAFRKFDAFVEAVLAGKIDLFADVLKIMLTNTEPLPTHTVRADLVEIPAGNGYPAGGSPLEIISATMADGVFSLTAKDVTFTATGGSFGPWRWAVLYDDSTPDDRLICFWDYGQSFTTPDGSDPRFPAVPQFMRVSFWDQAERKNRPVFTVES